jgi:hypothetical protein
MSEIILYTTEDGITKINVQLENETVWLTQEQMANLFGKARSTITEHISNIFVEGELIEKVVCWNIRLTTQLVAIEGKTQEKASDLYATATAGKNYTNSILMMAN